MEKATHIINIGIAVDYTDIIDNKGVKMVLGLKDTDNIVEHFASTVLDEINNKVLSAKSELMMMVSGTVSKVAPENDGETSISDTPDTPDTPVAQEWEPYSEPTQEPDDVPEPQETEAKETNWGESFFSLVDSMSSKLFNIRSFGGTNCAVYLGDVEYEAYGTQVQKEVGVAVDRLSKYEGLEEGFRYVIAYEDVEGNTKLITKEI